jgi:hypothetical protein
MKILVLDLYHHPRDLAQTDMYYALRDYYEDDIIFANKKNIFEFVKRDNYDFLYLGIYHPWCGLSK